MARRKNADFWESAKMNNATFFMFYSRLVELAISVFEWKNLPSTIDERFLELTLFAEGQAVFFKDEVMGYLALQNRKGGQLDVYRIPKQRQAYAVNGYNKPLNEKDSVIIFNNYLHTNSMLLAELYAKRLYNLERAIDLNVNAQKTPLLIVCDENERLSMENLYMNYDGNKPIIKGAKGINANTLQVLRTDAPFLVDKLQEQKERIWNEALTHLGIANTNVEKKERLTADEASISQGATAASRYSKLEARRKACDKINAMFGLDIWCDFREDGQLYPDLIEGEPDTNGTVAEVEDNE